MKILVIFYSRTGLTKKIAVKIAATLGADLEEIIDKDKRRGAWGYLKSGREAMQKKLASIEPLTKHPTDYDLVVIGTPTWAYAMSSPVRSFLIEQAGHFKRIALFTTHGSDGGDRALRQIEDLVGLEARAKLVATSREALQDSYQEKFSLFISQIHNYA